MPNIQSCAQWFMLTLMRETELNRGNFEVDLGTILHTSFPIYWCTSSCRRVRGREQGVGGIVEEVGETGKLIGSRKE